MRMGPLGNNGSRAGKTLKKNIHRGGMETRKLSKTAMVVYQPVVNSQLQRMLLKC